MPPTARASHAALLLAAGGSRRLGRSKALLCRDGKPLVWHAASLLLATGPRELVVVLGAEAASVGAVLANLPVRTIVNPDWEQGLATSVQTGIRALHAESGAVLVATVDQVTLTTAHLVALLDAAGSGDAASGYAGTFGVPACLGAATLRRVHELRGDRGFGVLWRNGVRPPIVDAPELAFDIDTPAALAEAVSAGWIDAD